jgi:hypothetical protein
MPFTIRNCSTKIPLHLKVIKAQCVRVHVDAFGHPGKDGELMNFKSYLDKN